jgi:DNA-binding IclR family transcriptional regulator
MSDEPSLQPENAVPDRRAGAADGDGGGKPVGAVVHAVRLLRVLADANAPLGVTAAARAAEVNPSTAFQILRTLVREGLVGFDPTSKLYRPGLGLLDLTRGLLGGNQAELLRPELVRLATNYECLVALWRITDERAILIDRALADTPVRLDIQVTQRIPAFIGAIGRIVAARLELPPEELRRRFAYLRWDRPLSFDDYLEQVRQAGDRGYGLDLGNLYDGIHVAASVVCDGQRRPTLGVSAITLGQAGRPERLEEIGETLAALCRTVSG